MDERIKVFIDELRYQLKGLPEGEISDAVSYYEEYLSESLEEGKNLDEVIAELGSPEKIGESIRRETNIARAENNPGIRNFSRVIGDAFRGVKTPLAVFSLSVTALFFFCMIAVIFGAAAVSGIGAGAILLICIYQAFTIPFKFFLEILGTIGIGLMSSGIFAVAAIYLWSCGRLFIRLSTKQIRLMQRISGKSSARPLHDKSKRVWPAARGILIATLTGFILFGISGLPMRFLTIFNSMKDESRISRTITEYNPKDINKISAVTAHSIIKLEEGSSDKIVISYEEPDWLAHEVKSGGGVLYFHEKSNGRLPLFSLISIHESMTELTISIPKGFKIDSISLESTGGHIFISGIEGKIEAKTLTGRIEYEGSTIKNSITASTGSGSILVEGIPNNSREYISGTNSNTTVKLTSNRGNIIIK